MTRRSRRSGGQTIEIRPASIPFEWKFSCLLQRLLYRLFLLKVLIDSIGLRREKRRHARNSEVFISSPDIYVCFKSVYNSLKGLNDFFEYLQQKHHSNYFETVSHDDNQDINNEFKAIISSVIISGKFCRRFRER